MALFNLNTLCAGLDGSPWVSLLRDWDRTLRAANHPETTRYNYLLAAAQLARYLRSDESEYAGSAAALDPAAVKKRHVETFQAWMIETRSAATALNKHKSLQQFFKWLVSEEEIETSPMDRVPQPKTEQKLIPVMRDDETKKLITSIRQKKDFSALRDEALVRLYYNTGARSCGGGRQRPACSRRCPDRREHLRLAGDGDLARPAHGAVGRGEPRTTAHCPQELPGHLRRPGRAIAVGRDRRWPDLRRASRDRRRRISQCRAPRGRPRQPDARYASYVPWLGVADEADVGRVRAWPQGLAIESSGRHYFLGYPLPALDGSQTPGRRRLGWGWTRTSVFRQAGSVRGDVVCHSLTGTDIPDATYAELARENARIWPSPWS
ncbi:hypothetical protein BJ973_000240 [Actinoplanes tereljensis]|uniref:Core-binding (CB) domain-containing protein n=1 Tax=Paractinoplanes tereljensis TaxID=571912 RepID=A0A919NTB1_9ACTN|nr:phage integrase N-terminal SAM-like domain-containing protein [Actinoplanes tereljensis]GIF23402.1 hypothetical protein Ate02nite_61320 [Actinoplanes tereljensis]